MTRTLTPVLLLAAFALTSCHTYDDNYYVGESTYLLAEIKRADGPTDIFELQVISPAQAFLNITTEGKRPFRRVGLNLRELDKATAQKFGYRPGAGLIVRSVDRESPAEKAGIRPDDLVVAVGGKEVYYLETYEEIVRGMVDGTGLEFTIRSSGEESVDRPVSVVPDTGTRKTTGYRSIPLEKPLTTNPTVYAGLVVRAVPKEYSKQIYGDDRNVIVLSGVALGSPAYHAGLRAGDILASVDGRAVPDLAGLLRLFRTRGPRGDTVQLEIRRDTESTYSASVTLDDYSGVTKAHIPIVFNAAFSARRTHWDLILGGWLAGYSNSYTSSKTRASDEIGSFSMLLGLFKYSWGPSGRRTRLLWFISFG